jgi:hypothetical protein
MNIWMKEKCEGIYIPCKMYTNGTKFNYKKSPLLACINRCQSKKDYYKECKGCRKWREFLPKSKFKRIYFPIRYYIRRK